MLLWRYDFIIWLICRPLFSLLLPTQDSIYCWSCVAQPDLFAFLNRFRWRGKYERFFAFTNSSILNIDPGNWTITNVWSLSDVVDFAPNTSSPDEFTVTVREGKKNSVLKFGCAYRALLLNDLQRYRKGADESQSFRCYKITRNHQREECTLKVRPSGLSHVNIEGEEITTYQYREIDAVRKVRDDASALVLVTGDRQHLYVTPDRDHLVNQIAQAVTKLGQSSVVEDSSVTMQDFRNYRTFLGNDDAPKMAEFEVLKVTPRFPTPRPRRLVVTETNIVERDPKTYAVISARPLTAVFSIVRQWNEPQQLTIEYKV